MSQSEAEWLEQHAQRLLNNQKAAVDTAKLLTTFVAAVSATLVATALQVGSAANDLDRRATLWLAFCVGATIATVLLDRLQAPDHEAVLEKKLLNGWSSHQTLTELRLEELATVRFNRLVVNAVQLMVFVQIVLASVAGTLAVLSLLAVDVH